MSYECVETRGGRHKSHRKGRMTHFLHCVIQPFPPLPAPSPWGRAETRRVEESQKSLWVSGQISHEGVADSFLRNACIFLGRKKNEIVSPPRVFFFFFGLSRALFISTVTYCIYYSCGGGMTSTVCISSNPQIFQAERTNNWAVRDCAHSKGNIWRQGNSIYSTGTTFTLVTGERVGAACF